MNKKLIIYPLLFSAGLLQARQKPNIAIIFTDDQVYQDLGCYGSPLIQTPSIDRMAKEGLKLTDFYVSSSVSGASYAGLLTDRLKTQNGVKGVFSPESERIHSEEITLTDDRQYWVQTIVKIADPVISNLSKDQLKKNIPVGRSSSALASSREFVTHMEAVGRTIAGIAPWLELGPDDTPEGKLREKYIKMTCKALANSVNPESNDYFNSTATRQILVNSAFLIQGLLQAPTQLWGNLDVTTRERLIEQWKSTRTMKPGNNNWLLFSAMVECGLKEFSGEWDYPVVERAVNSHREWYKGDGIYGDGADFHLDYYNSYVIHPLLLQILKVTVKQKPSLQLFLNEEWIRFVRYAEIQERMIAPDGSYPVLGRSVSYRSAAFQVLGACALFGKLPESLQPGQVRGAMTAMLKRLFEQPGTFDKDGWLTIGVCGEQPELGDTYLSTPCVYLCSLGFLPLGLPSNDPFWHNPVEPWTSIKAFGGMEFPIDKFIKP